jgi:hypothetical protein
LRAFSDHLDDLRRQQAEWERMADPVVTEPFALRDLTG